MPCKQHAGLQPAKWTVIGQLVAIMPQVYLTEKQSPPCYTRPTPLQAGLVSPTATLGEEQYCICDLRTHWQMFEVAFEVVDFALTQTRGP